MPSVASATKFSFTGHETFPFRYTWPTKGVRLTMEYPDLFTRDDAIAILGVGKNMVTSIRHWCDVLGLIEKDGSGSTVYLRPSELGLALYGKEGWDPYLEDPGTLWLLHWKLVSRKERASAWYLAFTQWNTEAFTREKLVDWLWTVAQTGSSSSTKPSLQRDVDVFVRTYVPARQKRDAPIEDTFDCPLVELGVMEELDPGLYHFVRGPKPTLPDLIFLYALLEYWQSAAPNQRTLSFESVMHSPGSPGAAFKLTENALAQKLEALPAWSTIQYDETAGMRVLLRRDDTLINNPLMVLERYYSRANPLNLIGEAHV